MGVGDIVLYRYGNGYVIHRVVSIEKNQHGLQLKTKGDANPDPDPWIVDGPDVVGVALFKIPRAGIPLLKLQGHAPP